MAESSYENPEINMSFKLNATNAIKLKQPIAALCDSEFNPKGEGMVEVTEKGFQITVSNAETHAIGNLFLNSSGLINFHCSNPIVGKMINLSQISQILNDATDECDDDTITVFHFDGSTNLSFIFGSAPTVELKVEFLQTYAKFEKLHDMEITCETGLQSETLREMIDQLIQKGKLVSVDISEKLVTIYIGQRNDSWFFKIKKDDENFEAKVLTDAHNYHAAWFELTHLEAMKKASNVAPQFHLRFLTGPSKKVMTRFNLQELAGDLVFIHKAMVMFTNNPKYNVGENFEHTQELIRFLNCVQEN